MSIKYIESEKETATVIIDFAYSAMVTKVLTVLWTASHFIRDCQNDSQESLLDVWSWLHGTFCIARRQKLSLISLKLMK